MSSEVALLSSESKSYPESNFGFCGTCPTSEHIHPEGHILKEDDSGRSTDTGASSFESFLRGSQETSSKIIEVEKQTVNADNESQSIFRVTLTGPALLFTILCLCISVHLLQPYVLSIVVFLFPLPFAIHNDYRAFLSLGPGGTPSTFAGYLKITFLRLFALRDPFKPVSVQERYHLTPRQGFFDTNAVPLIPHRTDPRPRVEGIAPQRQRNQIGPEDIYLRFRQACHNLAASNPYLLYTAQSCFEKNGLALFAKQPINATCRGEVCHVHHTDHSFHMNLHPDDVRIVLERGWGQRHPLAKGGFMGRYVPREFVMVYSPRDDKELEVVGRIVEAAAWWVTGREVRLEFGDEASENTEEN